MEVTYLGEPVVNFVSMCEAWVIHVLVHVNFVLDHEITVLVPGDHDLEHYTAALCLVENDVQGVKKQVLDDLSVDTDLAMSFLTIISEVKTALFLPSFLGATMQVHSEPLGQVH